jgi:hypothetical protein
MALITESPIERRTSARVQRGARRRRINGYWRPPEWQGLLPLAGHQSLLSMVTSLRRWTSGLPMPTSVPPLFRVSRQAATPRSRVHNCFEGSSGISLSKPRKSASSVIVSTFVSIDGSSRPRTGRDSCGRIGAASASGSSISTCSCME